VREIQGRYRGSYLGIAWALVTPLLMLLVYTFVFHTILKLQWDDGQASFVGYAAPVFSGIVAFGVFSESVTRAPLLIVQNPNYVKRWSSPCRFCRPVWWSPPSCIRCSASLSWSCLSCWAD